MKPESGYTGALKAPVRCFGNHCSGGDECGGAATPEEMISRMGTPVDWLQLFAQCRIQSVYLSHGAIVDRVGRNDIGLISIVLNAIKNGFSERAVIATELVVPSAGIVLGAEDRGGFFPSSVQQF